jgi:DNA-binding transcriptional ArsR family regulator
MTDFCLEYPKLEHAQREHFRRVVTRLLSGHVITPGEALRPDRDWRFAERHQELIDGYLRIGGWRMDLDRSNQQCRAVHEAGEQRVRFNKLESLVLCSLRLIYHEQMRAADETERCVLKVGELRERLALAGRSSSSIQRRALSDALKRLQRHALVALDRGFQGEDAESITVSPLIAKVLAPDKVAELARRVRAYASPSAEVGDDPAGEDEGGGDPP